MDLFDQLQTMFLRNIKYKFYYAIDIVIDKMDFLALVKAVVKYLKRSPEEQFSETTLHKMIDPFNILKEQENDSRLKNIKR